MITTSDGSALLDALAEHLATRRPLAPRLTLARDELIQACPEAAGLATLVARLYDPNFDPAWLQRLWPCTQLLITTTAEALGASAPSCRQLRRDLASIHNAVCRLPAPRRSLFHLATPLAAFHWSMQSLAQRGRALLYLDLAPLIHTRLRRLEHAMLPRRDEFGTNFDRNLYDYLRSARLLCRYGIRTALWARQTERSAFAIGRFVAPAAAQTLLEDAVERWTRGERTTPALPTVAKRVAHLEVLLGIRDHEIHPHNSPARASAAFVTRLRVLTLHDGAADPEGEVWQSAVMADPHPAAAQEGELPVDYARLIEHGRPAAPSAIVSGRAPIRFGTADRVAMARLGLIHDGSTTQPFEFANVYSTLFDRPAELMDGAQLSAALFGGLIVLHGLDPRTLGTLRPTVGQPPGDAGPSLDLKAGTLWMPLPSVGYAGPLRHELAAVCRSGSGWASVPLLPWLRRIATRYQQVRPTSPSDPAGSVFWSDGDGYADDSPLPGVIGTPSLERRLARSATRWLVHRGMEPIFAAIVSGKFNFAALATSAYANLSDAQLAEAHARSATRFHMEILAECRHQGHRLAHLEDPDLTSSAVSESRRFGARIVPRLEALTAAIDALESRRRAVRVDAPLREMIGAFNLAMVYAWLRLSWATAIRPRRDPVVRRGRYDPHLGWLLVEDKDSPFGVEARLIPLADGEGSRLSRLQDLGDRVRWRLRATSHVALDGLSDDCLFFVILGGRAIPLSPEALRSVLDNTGLADSFSWPLNVPRHYWITRALENGVRLTDLDPFLGHLHDPLPWGPYAVRPLADSAASFRRFAATILKEVGFRDTA
jgi:hypothetical protein